MLLMVSGKIWDWILIINNNKIMIECSFIIPVYNCEKYLENCIQSIMKNEFNECEVILVDDGSTDASGKLCDYFANAYPTVRCIHQKNQGVSFARNRGIQNAKGEYLVFVDADDSIDAERIMLLTQNMKDNNIDMTIFGISFEYYANGQCYRKEEICYPQEGIMHPVEWCERFEEIFCCNGFSSACNKIFKRENIIRNDIRFSTKMFVFEDLDFVLRYMTRSELILNIADAIYHYRQTEDGKKVQSRVKNICNISEYLVDLKDTFDGLQKMVYQKYNLTLEARKRVLLKIYFILIGIKFEQPEKEEIKAVIQDFQQWFRENSYEISDVAQEDKTITTLMLNSRVSMIYYITEIRKLRQIIIKKIKGNQVIRKYLERRRKNER